VTRWRQLQVGGRVGGPAWVGDNISRLPAAGAFSALQERARGMACCIFAGCWMMHQQHAITTACCM
jgi:hypothetical protein